MSQGDCMTEYARTGTSKCKQCKVTLAKGAFRVGIRVLDPFGQGYLTNAWYHVPCFFAHKFKQGHPTSTSAFEGFKELKKEDQKTLAAAVKVGQLTKEQAQKQLAAAADGAAADSDDDSPAPSPKKKKAAASKKKAATKRARKDADSDEEEEEEEEAPKAKKGKAAASSKKAAAAASPKSPKASTKKKSTAAGGVFSGLTFCLSGKFSAKKADLEADIVSHGGKVAGGVTKAVTHVASNEWGKQGDKCVKAKEEGKECVTEAWIEKAIKANGKLPKTDA